MPPNISKKYVGLGLIGLGHIHESQAAALREVDSIQGVALCDVDPSRPGAEALQGLPRYRQPADLLADESVEAVLVAVPLRDHYEVARAAIDSRKHVLLEKPATKSVSELRELYQLADQAGVQLVIAFHASFARDLLWFREYYPSNLDRLGPITGFYCGFYDPYVTLEGEKPATVCLGGSWTDSGINALSVIATIIKNLSVESGRFTSPPGFKATEIQSTVDLRFSIDGGGGIGLGTIDTNWTLDLDRKFTRIVFGDSRHVVFLDHTNQGVYEVGPDGSERPLANLVRHPRLVEHYIGVLNDFSAHISNRTDNRAFALTLHELLEEGRNQAHGLRKGS